MTQEILLRDKFLVNCDTDRSLSKYRTERVVVPNTLEIAMKRVEEKSILLNLITTTTIYS